MADKCYFFSVHARILIQVIEDATESPGPDSNRTPTVRRTVVDASAAEHRPLRDGGQHVLGRDRSAREMKKNKLL